MRIVLASALLLVATPALADQPGRDWITAARVNNILQERGFRVGELNAKKHHWEGKAYRYGVKYDFRVNPWTGRVTRLRRA